MNTKLVKILLVDDDPGDVKLTQKSFEKSKFHTKLFSVSDGVECMAYLRKEGKYKEAEMPDLILLDLNMPKKDGRETIAEIKKDPNFCSLPVVILTTSDAENDIVKTYQLGANCYIVKPVDFDKFQDIVNHISEFWFSIVKLPTLK